MDIKELLARLQSFGTGSNQVSPMSTMANMAFAKQYQDYLSQMNQQGMNPLPYNEFQKMIMQQQPQGLLGRM